MFPPFLHAHRYPDFFPKPSFPLHHRLPLELLGLFKVWRNLRPDEVVSDGLSAKLPGRNMSIAGHLMNGSRHNGAQFISTTTDPKVIEKWNEPGQRIVMFDTDDVIPDVLGNKNIIDVSTPEKARAAGLKRGRPYSNAVSSKEVLVDKPSDTTSSGRKFLQTLKSPNKSSSIFVSQTYPYRVGLPPANPIGSCCV